MARALAADPPVLLMDEPFSAVDPVVRKGLQDELLRIQDELGKTIVFVTHDIDEAIKLGTMVAVLREGGRLAQYAPPAELLSNPADSFVEDFLGADRGIRRLSFFTSDALELTTDAVVPAGAPDAPLTTARTPYLLVTDAEGRPLGWRERGSEGAARTGCCRTGGRSGPGRTRCGQRWTARSSRPPAGRSPSTRTAG